METMKDCFIKKLEELEEKSGFDLDNLEDVWFDYCRVCAEAGGRAFWDEFCAKVCAVRLRK